MNSITERLFCSSLIVLLAVGGGCSNSNSPASPGSGHSVNVRIPGSSWDVIAVYNTDASAHQGGVEGVGGGSSTLFQGTADISGAVLRDLAPGAQFDINLQFVPPLRVVRAFSSVTVSISVGTGGLCASPGDLEVTPTGSWSGATNGSLNLYGDTSELNTIFSDFSFQPEVGQILRSLRAKFTIPTTFNSGGDVPTTAVLALDVVRWRVLYPGDETAQPVPIQPAD